MIGNDVNNQSSNINWNNILNDIITYCNYNNDIDFNNVPFPLIYEQIYLYSKKFNYDKESLNEYQLKEFIGNIVDSGKINEIHKLIVDFGSNNVITTNYDYNLELAISGKEFSRKNQGIVNEKKYSVFRHTKNNDINIWHIHGESALPDTITLGFEHYGGQLQHLRNYITGALNYKNTNIQKFDIEKIIKNKNQYTSWVDIFFSNDIHILGLGLNYQEIDIWWLISNRARLLNKMNMDIHTIYYHCPEKHFSKSKSDIMMSLGIVTKVMNYEGTEYYKRVLGEIDNLTTAST
ncbi:SIR2-like domain-containing protein [Alkalispirochaeta americana]|uniref:SIR2-like domain-containing protein n=1 Tax=Alkalispirochaeta americana TaxID=159291 RepID=A0A1N6WX66_9SPIO|nr:SIR2 family protein [Alkalispirochaeta americana]SIQ94677.1 SIR2-like domain-containing protein [Alkalispirochaeta americana]